MATPEITTASFDFASGHTRYVSAGPVNGPLIVLVHGWIGVAEIWKPQLLALASLGFLVVAPDTRGYGGSTVTKRKEDYRLEQHVEDMVALLAHLKRPRAVWIGHDWGALLVWSFAAHRPELCAGVVGMSVPYRTGELGIEQLESFVNRDIYPIDEYPLGQWDYLAFHQESPDKFIEQLQKNSERSVGILFAKRPREGFGMPARTATTRKNGSFAGVGVVEVDVPVENTLLNGLPEAYDGLVKTIKENGMFGPNAYYRNFELNKAYTKESVNGGVLEMPVMYLTGRFDSICDTTFTRWTDPMREYCKNVTECVVNTGHWVGLEDPEATNAAIVRWLATKLPTYWPGYWNSPLTSN